MTLKTKMLFYALLCTLFMACSKDDDDNGGPVTFHVTISDVEAYTATATITHNGSNRDNYYVFAVEGHVDNTDQAIKEMLASNRAQEILDNPINQRKRVLKVSGLLPRKTFTYIVFGRNADGQLFGVPGSAEFTTTNSNITAAENPNWAVTYKGHKVYNDWDYSLVNVHLQGNAEERFFLYVCDTTKAATFNTMEDFIFFATEEFTQKKNATDDDDFWLDASEVRTDGTNFYRHLEPGDYVAYAIGLNADGSPTGHYAKCRPFHVDPYPYTDVYAYLTDGYWLAEDQNGKSYVVGFEKSIVNRTLHMWGWGNYDEFEIVVSYDRNTNALSIPSQAITNDNVTINFSSGDKTGKVYLYGAYYNAEGNLKWTSQSHTIAKGTFNSDSTYTFKAGYYVTLDDAGTRATELGMSFVMYLEDHSKTGFGRMMFPFTFRKLED